MRTPISLSTSAVMPRALGLRRAVALVIVASLAAAASIAPGAAATAAQRPLAPTPLVAPPADAFDPGSIITDPLFYDFGTMTADEVQQFLDTQVASCSPASEAPCLKDYSVDTSDIEAVPGRCANDISGADAQSAAMVIVTVARACEVNPQVLLVTLQKEQGLVTADSVAALKYRKAMGYGCPDTAECASKYYGFFKQVYWAARSFHAYSATPAAFRYQPGDRDSVAFSPVAGCGSTRITMQNRATAALYNYTPYTPNEASLANPYEQGDECSSYGNRNFWLYFTSWFGDPGLGQYLVTSGGSTWLVVGRERWKLPAGSPYLGSALRALGLRGAVSRDYLDDLSDRGALSPIVQLEGNADRYYLLSSASDAADPKGDAVKYVIEGCDRVRGLGFSCDVPVFRPSVLKAFTRSTDLQWRSAVSVRATDGRLYQLGPNGSKSTIVDEVDAVEPILPVDTPVVSRIPVANPLARPGSLLVDPVSGDGYYLPVDGTRTLVIERSFLASSDAPDWFGGVDGELDAASVAVLPQATTLPPFFTASGRSWMLGASGRIPLASPGDWAVRFTSLDPALAALVPVDPAYLAAPLATPATLATTHGETRYMIGGGVREPTDAFAGEPVRVPAATLVAIPRG